MRPDGSDLKAITTPIYPYNDWRGDWLPDGKSILFVREKADSMLSQHILIWSEESGEKEIRTEDGYPLVGFNPRSPPDGKRIIYQKLSDQPNVSEYDIWIVNRDGSANRRLAPGQVVALHLSGKGLFYFVHTEKRTKCNFLYRLLDFNQEKLITKNTCPITAAWNHANTLLAVAMETPLGSCEEMYDGIIILDSIVTVIRDFRKLGGWEKYEVISWSWDDTRLAFQRTTFRFCGGDGGIYVMKQDGTGASPVLKNKIYLQREVVK